MDLASYLPLVGIPVVVAGFALRFNPLLVVTAAGLSTGLAVGMDLGALLETFGEKFLNSRQLATFILILPVIGLLERYGLKERAQQWIAGIRSATTARILMLYFVVRELTAALGLINLGGHAQTVRPLLAPMAEGAAANQLGELPPVLRDRIRAHAAACDNIAVFFGEDIFIAFGAVLLMDAFLKENGIANIEPLHIGLWAIPTAVSALIIHMARLARLDARLQRDIAALFASHFSPQAFQAEADYFAAPGRTSYERPYGWAWLLALAQELEAWNAPQSGQWREAMRPLLTLIRQRWLTFLPLQDYLICSGWHDNTAFVLRLAESGTTV
ncbi:5-oxoproline transporter, DUF969 family subunit [Chromobacterium haemolyticum]|uniref:5-oxoproline transporter, DUF969 family subunit n=1 Tax=Chromobacterium haemolyticum TaxID=394935 RepID=UPI00307D794B